MIKVGINGFGRIGRFVFRAAQTRNDIVIVGINDLCPVDYLAYMLKYDTMHGQFDGTIEADIENNKLIVNGNASDFVSNNSKSFTCVSCMCRFNSSVHSK